MTQMAATPMISTGPPLVDAARTLARIGFEQYFRDLAALGGPRKATPEQFAELMQRYRFESRPKTIPELLERFGLRMGEPLTGGGSP